MEQDPNEADEVVRERSLPAARITTHVGTKESGASYQSQSSRGARITTHVGTKESGASYQSQSSRGSVVRFKDDAPDDEAPEFEAHEDSPTSRIDNESHHRLEIPGSLRHSNSGPTSLQALDSQNRRVKNMSKDTQNSHVTQDSRQSMSSFRAGSSKSPRGSTASGSFRPTYVGPSRHTTKDTNLTGETGSSGSQSRPSRKSSLKRLPSSAQRSKSRSKSGSVGRSGRSRSSHDITNSTSSLSSSSSDELSERELALMDQSVLPLHLRAGAIRSKENDFGNQTQMHAQVQQLMLADVSHEYAEGDEEQYAEKDTRSNLLILLSRYLGHEDGELNDGKKKRKESIMMQNWQLIIRVYPCIAWCVVVMFILLLWLLRYFGMIETDAQRVVARSLMLQAEVRVAASLAPTFTLVSSLAMAAKAGLLSNSSYADLANVLTPHLLDSPSVQYVRVVGATDLAATLRAGSLHDTSLHVLERIPLMLLASAPCEHAKRNPTLCLELDKDALIEVPEDGAAVGWQKPGFLTEDSKGQTLQVTSWLYAHRLAAQVDVADGSQGLRLAVEASIDLSKVDAAVRASVADGSTTYITTADGTVVAGSAWNARGEAQYDPVTGTVVYPRLWDLGLSWTESVTFDMVAGSRQVDVWSGTDIVVVRPLAVGHPSSGSFRAGMADLRIISTVPRKAATSEDMKNLVVVGMVTLGAPGVFILIAIAVLAMSACFMSFMHWLFEFVQGYQ